MPNSGRGSVTQDSSSDSQKPYTGPLPCTASTRSPLMPRRPSLVTPIARAALVATVAALALSTAAVHAPAANAATPCWKQLLNDWYDGRIDQTYAVHCYQDALKHLPADVQTYSSAHDDILRALQSAIARRKGEHKAVGANTLVPPQKGGGSGGGTKTGGGPGNKGGDGLAGKLNPSSPSSVPVPLLVLGGLALLLVAAGAAGLIAKRIQSRRLEP
jgi:hypothetical protein